MKANTPRLESSAANSSSLETNQQPPSQVYTNPAPTTADGLGGTMSGKPPATGPSYSNEVSQQLPLNKARSSQEESYSFAVKPLKRAG